MAKDYTDYCMVILGWKSNPLSGMKERTYHIEHRSTRVLEKNKVYEFEFNKHSYLFNPGRAVHLRRWTPWLEFDFRHPIKSINELTRYKRIGLLIYHEPDGIVKIINGGNGK